MKPTKPLAQLIREKIELVMGTENQTDNIDEEYSPKNPKIDIFHKKEYQASTNWSPTIKHAKARWMEKHPEHSPNDLSFVVNKK